MATLARESGADGISDCRGDRMLPHICKDAHWTLPASVSAMRALYQTTILWQWGAGESHHAGGPYSTATGQPLHDRWCFEPTLSAWTWTSTAATFI